MGDSVCPFIHIGQCVNKRAYTSSLFWYSRGHNLFTPMYDLIAKPWSDYELLDSGDGKRLERFGSFTIVRPDSTCIWKPSTPTNKGWFKPDLRYAGSAGKGEWQGDAELLKGWNISWEGARFAIVPTPFRHLSLFPEQSAHWEWLREKVVSIKASGRTPRVLNLFAYTGGASVVAAKYGASVCHVDASKASIYKAKDNATLSGLNKDAIRWIAEDAVKFMRREARRGSKYDIIIMDPPVFGRGSQGEIWRLEEGLQELGTLSRDLLSEQADGFLINFYATSLYPDAVRRLMTDILPISVKLGALHIQESLSGERLETGFFLRS